MAELTRKNAGNSALDMMKKHQGMIIFILILIIALFITIMIIEEKIDITGQVVKNDGGLQASAPAASEARDSKTGYDDIIVTSGD